MKSLLADIAPRGVWDRDQERALKAVMTTLVNTFDDVLFLRGKRVKIESADEGSERSFVIDCPFRPRSVTVLAVTQVREGETLGISSYLMAWRWTASPTGGAVTLVDGLGLLDEGYVTLDVFMERS